MAIKGKLHEGCKKEISVKPSGDETKVPTLLMLRDMMGWDAKDICEHELIVSDEIVKGHVPVRVYRKKSLVDKQLPVLLYIHGGGFFGGSIQNVEQICRTFADREDMIVISIGYRLAPEYPYPQGLMDCYDVLSDVVNRSYLYGCNGEVYAAGDSAGANLSITLGLLDHHFYKTKYTKGLIMYYPVVELISDGKGEFWDVEKIYVEDDEERELVHQHIKGFGLQNVQICNWYAGDVDKKHPLLSPLYATKEQLQSLPPMKIIIGEFDALKLQNDAFVEYCKQNGIEVDYQIYEGMTHAFMDKIGVYDEALKGVEDGIHFIKQIR